MTFFVDLHVHSRHSDGILTPSELVAMAVSKGLRAMALADHDAIGGIEEAVNAGKQAGVEVIPAVELSVEFRQYHDVHLLGYFIDHRDLEFQEKLMTFRRRRDERGKAIVEKINEKLSWEGRGTILYEDVVAAADGALGRPHIGRVLMNGGVVRTMQEAFEKYLVPCDVPKLYFPVTEAICEIKRIGGVPVLAHPTSITTNHRELREVIAQLKNLGLEGMEVYNNLCDESEWAFLRGLAATFGLVMTGGSDFHGSEPDIQMGSGRGKLKVPYELVEALRSRITH